MHTGITGTTHMLWKTIHGLSNRAPPPTLNTSITFSNKIATTPKHQTHCKLFHLSIHKHASQTYPLIEQHIKHKDMTSHSPQLRPISLLSVIANILVKSPLPYITANTPNTPM